MPDYKAAREVLSRIGKCNIIIDVRGKNLDTKYELGWSEEDQIEFVKSLELKDLFEGPLPNDNIKDRYPVWIFKKSYTSDRSTSDLPLSSGKLYVKFSDRGKNVMVISIHIDE